MSDYSQLTDYSDKDALTAGDPEKIILGADIDAELSAISTAIATKYDSSDLASLAEAQAEADNTVLMTPARVGDWADANAGIVGDLQALADPGADRILFWDDSAGAAALLSVGSNLSLSGTTLDVGSNIPKLDASNTFTGATQTISSSSATTLALRFNGSGSGDVWDIEVRSGAFQIRPRTDALGLGDEALEMTSDTSANVLTITANADTEIELNTTTLDVNANADISGTLAVGGNVTLGAQDVFRAVDNDALQIYGGTNSNGAFLTLFGGTHASQAKNALLNADQLTVNDQANANNFFQVKSTLIDTFTVPVRANTIANSTSETLVAGQIHHVDANCTVPTLAAGQWVAIVNHSASAITLTRRAGTALYWTLTGEDSATVTIGARGRVVVSCAAAGSDYVSGDITGNTT